MKRTVYAVLLAAMIIGAGIPVLAHHSFAAAYDTSKTIKVQGTITRVRLENPHSWFFLDVKEPDGKITQWKFEAGTPSGMIRNGFKSSEIKSGTVVTITGCPAKDASSNAGMLRQLVLENGKTYAMFGPVENATR
jgi:hypothetical protein